MDFRLLYEGELLPSAGTNKRAEEKHVIRKIFHPQLRRLWAVEQNLRELAMRRSGPDDGDPRPVNARPSPITNQERFEFGIEATGRKWIRANYHCVPPVTAQMDLRCSLDILLLRPEDDRFIFQSGDIDGQLKTLFDALRMPKTRMRLAERFPTQRRFRFFVCSKTTG
jgi:hypothetical protein